MNNLIIMLLLLFNFKKKIWHSYLIMQNYNQTAEWTKLIFYTKLLIDLIEKMNVIYVYIFIRNS